MLDNVFLLYDGPKEIEAFQWAGDMWYLPKNDPQILERQFETRSVIEAHLEQPRRGAQFDIGGLRHQRTCISKDLHLKACISRT